MAVLANILPLLADGANGPGGPRTWRPTEALAISRIADQGQRATEGMPQPVHCPWEGGTGTQVPRPRFSLIRSNPTAG